MRTATRRTITGAAREAFCATISRASAAESMVLMKNDKETLPFKAEGSRVRLSVFGIGQIYTVKGGTGSGEVNNQKNVSFLKGLSSCDCFEVDELLVRKYLNWAASHPNKAKEAFMTPESNSNEEMPVSEELASEAAARSDAAVIIISRITGEGADIKGGKGDYYLSDAEQAMIDAVTLAFPKCAVVLNTAGVIDTAGFRDKAPAILFVGLPGQEAGHALADVLSGTVPPSGKLTDTWPLTVGDHPSHKNFGTAQRNGNVNTVMGVEDEQTTIKYEEGIFVGYRYFDTFGLDVAYPFGFGLGYADFAVTSCSVSVEDEKVNIVVEAQNVSETYSGREVVQVYYSAPDGRLEKPYQELAAFTKTRLLAPGESDIVKLSFSLREMSSFSEADLAYILEKGYYYIRVGRGSRDTAVVSAVHVTKEIKTAVLSSRMGGPESGFNLLSKRDRMPIAYEGEDSQKLSAEKYAISVSEKNIRAEMPKYRQAFRGCNPAGEGLTLKDVVDRKCTVANVVAQVSTEELATLVCGVGMDLSGLPETVEQDMPFMPDMALSAAKVSFITPGAAGQTADFSEKYGIRAISLADGPAGVRIKRTVKNEDDIVIKRQNCTAFPVGTLLASSWDCELIRSVGAAVGTEMAEHKVDLWLAPGMNIHRHPYCGRNFEYYSEDPTLTGLVASAITDGVQSCGVGVTIKHFAANNQEEMRGNSNDIVTQRTLREIYLKGFEICVKASKPLAIMTSYNDINGVPSADNYDLCTAIARDEWGFDGLIMTDWGGGLSSPALSMYAGNDMIQPGGEGMARQIVEAVDSGKPVVSKGIKRVEQVITRAMLESCACHIIEVILKLPPRPSALKDTGI